MRETQERNPFYAIPVEAYIVPEMGAITGHFYM